MASIIRIKRSSTTNAPGSLKSGELAYSYGVGTQANNGDRFFFGQGDDGSGNATSIAVVGGKYFTDKLDHEDGVLTASSAITVDANSKVDVINVDNVTIDGNTISTTNTNGNLVLDPNGTGNIDASTSKIVNVVNPTSAQDAATKNYVDTADALKLNLSGGTMSGAIAMGTNAITGMADPSSAQDAATKAYVDGQITSLGASSTFDFAGDAGTGDITLQDSALTVSGGTGISTAASGTTLTVSISNTGVSANTYGSATEIPVITVNAQGQITTATTAAVSTELSIAGTSGTGSVDLIDSSLSVVGSTGVTTSVTGRQITITGTNATTSLRGVASFSAIDFSVTSGAVSIAAGGVSNAQLAGSISNDKLVNSSVTINGGTVSLGSSLTLTTGDVAEDSANGNVYYTEARFDASLSGKSTDDLTEGSNLYYTTARADSDAKNAVSAVDAGGDGSFAYNAASGEFTYTGPSATEARAHFSGGTGVTITDGVVAIGQAVDSNADVYFNTVTVGDTLVVEGNLQVNGTQTIINSTTLSVTDNMIYLNSGESDGSPTQFIDVGFAANYNDVGSYAHAGFFRDATDGTWKIFDGYTPEPDAAPQIDVSHATFNLANLQVGTLFGRYDGFDSDLGTKTTDDVAEGSNLYYTTARVDSDLATILLAGEGIDITNGSGTYTISGEDASTTNKGIASFDTTSFTVTTGAVVAKDLTFSTGDGSAAATIGETITFSGNATAGITTSGTGSTVTVSAVAATTTQRGTASFNTDNFEVTSGAVSIVTVDGGTY